eukprot:g373.t1
MEVESRSWLLEKQALEALIRKQEKELTTLRLQAKLARDTHSPDDDFNYFSLSGQMPIQDLPARPQGCLSRCMRRLCCGKPDIRTNVANNSPGHTDSMLLRSSSDLASPLLVESRGDMERGQSESSDRRVHTSVCVLM